MTRYSAHVERAHGRPPPNQSTNVHLQHTHVERAQLYKPWTVDWGGNQKWAQPNTIFVSKEPPRKQAQSDRREREIRPAKLAAVLLVRSRCARGQAGGSP